MSGLRSIGSLLTREERLVFLTVSLCLLGGGLFHLACSFFDLPDAIKPAAESPALLGDDGTDVRVRGTPGRGAGKDEVASDDSDVGQDAASASGPGAGAEAARGGGPGLIGKLDLNGATLTELDGLPGIGPALAQRILDERARVGGFRRVDDLLDVRGIGEKTLSRFRAYVYVSGPQK